MRAQLTSSGCNCDCHIEINLLHVSDVPYMAAMVGHQSDEYLMENFGSTDREAIGRRVLSASVGYVHDDSCMIHSIASSRWN